MDGKAHSHHRRAKAFTATGGFGRARRGAPTGGQCDTLSIFAIKLLPFPPRLQSGRTLSSVILKNHHGFRFDPFLFTGAWATHSHRRLGQEQRELLERVFEHTQKPGSETRAQLASELGVEEDQIWHWFRNRRTKRRREQDGSKHSQRRRNSLPAPQLSVSIPVSDLQAHQEPSSSLVRSYVYLQFFVLFPWLSWA